MSEIQLEFAVNIKNEQSAEKVRESLKNVASHIEIDSKTGRVIVKSSQPWSVLQDKIEGTGVTAVLCGFGGQSAVAIINTTGSDVDSTPIQGIVRFSTVSKDNKGVVVDGVVDGLSPGLHGLHVHESGDVSQGCASVGEHYNPRGSPHGSPDSAEHLRHAGDLGNIRADESGRATFRFVDSVLQVGDIIGRSVVITEREDDLGRGKTVRSRIDGNSGERIACGIIARAAGILQNYKKICACDGVTLWDERNKPKAGGTRVTKSQF